MEDRFFVIALKSKEYPQYNAERTFTISAEKILEYLREEKISEEDREEAVKEYIFSFCESTIDNELTPEIFDEVARETIDEDNVWECWDKVNDTLREYWYEVDANGYEIWEGRKR